MPQVDPPPELTLWRRGKVREVFAFHDDQLLIVASDRISAFDCILPTPIPRKGALLTALANFWFNFFHEIPHHVITADPERMPASIRAFAAAQEGRAVLVKRTEPLAVECVVRGYLAGSGWKEYQRDRHVGGHPFPEGLQLASELPEPLFTPSTKAAVGDHDENIDWDQCVSILGQSVAEQVQERSLALYRQAREHAAARGLIIADTKFEFGMRNGELLLIDEIFTPDSSRFWPADRWQPGHNPPSFDKQLVRDYLETLDWDKTNPAPELPPAIAQQTADQYAEAYRLITGPPLA